MFVFILYIYIYIYLFILLYFSFSHFNETSLDILISVTKTIIHLSCNIYIYIIYSGANKYLIHCQFFKFSHSPRMERSVIFIVGTPQL